MATNTVATVATTSGAVKRVAGPVGVGLNPVTAGGSR
jgi:hypothetical protein